MRSFKRTLFVMSFISNFFIRLGIFLILGIIFCVIGIKARICLGIGIGLIVFDFLVSLIETIMIFTTTKNSTTPIMKDLNDAINSEDGMSAMDSFLEKYSLPTGNGTPIQTTEERYLRTHLDDSSTVEDCVRVFKEMCEFPIDDDLLLFECYVDPYDNYVFSLIRQYPNGEDEYYQLCLMLKFEVTKENRKLTESIWNDRVPDFWEYIRNSKAYEYASTHESVKLEILLDET